MILKIKKEHNAESGWLGITDKFWITALVPEKTNLLGESLFINLKVLKQIT